MKRTLPFLFVFGAAITPGLQARDPANVDPSKQNSTFAPNAESADTPLSPGRESNAFPVDRNDHLQDQRFLGAEKIERKDSSIGDNRAPIDLKESRDKTIIDRKDAPKPEIKTYDKSHYDQQRASIQPKGDMLKSYDKVDRFQSRMTDAQTAASLRQPTVQKQTTFDKINRFVFKRNGVGSEEGRPVVTPAGAGNTPAPAQDTYTKYNVDWSKGSVSPEKVDTKLGR